MTRDEIKAVLESKWPTMHIEVDMDLVAEDVERIAKQSAHQAKLDAYQRAQFECAYYADLRAPFEDEPAGPIRKGKIIAALCLEGVMEKLRDSEAESEAKLARQRDVERDQERR
jgi:hypothetical protein